LNTSTRQARSALLCGPMEGVPGRPLRPGRTVQRPESQGSSRGQRAGKGVVATCANEGGSQALRACRASRLRKPTYTRPDTTLRCRGAKRCSGGFDELGGLFETSAREADEAAQDYVALAASYRAKGDRLQAECVMHMSRHHLIKSLNEQANAAARRAHKANPVRREALTQPRPGHDR